MREIRFRVWDVAENRMWDIRRIVFENGLPSSVFVTENNEITGKWLLGQDFILNQYTGLKDRGGKEICSGDIVFIDENTGEVWTVEYDDSQARFIVFNQLNSVRDFSIDPEHQHGDCPIIEIAEGKRWYPEVIGNIWENPELLTNN